MYFFDTFDFPFPKGSTYADIEVFNRSANYYSYYYLNNFVFVNNPDGTLGVYNDPNNFTGNTDSIQNFTSQITQEYCTLLGNKFDETRNEIINAYYSGYTSLPDCGASLITWPFQTFDNCSHETWSWFQTKTYSNIPNCYWDKRRQKCVTKTDPLNLDCCGDDFTIDFNQLLTQPLSDVKTVEEFEYYLSSELIDAKSRKTLSGYPTLRALYDRYTNSAMYTNTTSSAFDYIKIDKFASLIDSYWVDIVEQVVPATTIWGSVKIYGNTIFDQQKFQYRKGSLFTCTENCADLDDVNACLFNLIEQFYIKTSDDCHTNVCYQKGYGVIDFLDDLDQMPTSDQIRSLGAAKCGCDYNSLASVQQSYDYVQTVMDNSLTTLRNNHSYLDDQIKEYNIALRQGFCDGDAGVITPDPTLVNYASYPNEFYNLGKPIMIKEQAATKAIILDGWTANTDTIHGKTLEQIYSAYTNDFNYIKAVPNIGALPIIGNAGELIFVGTLASKIGYAWDPISNIWSTNMYDFINTEILDDRLLTQDNHRKAKQEMLSTMRPFTWANYHLLLHPIKLWALQDEPIITGNDIVNSATDITPCSYLQKVEPCELMPFCGPYKHIDNVQC